MMKTAILAFSRRGRLLAQRIEKGLAAQGHDCRVFVSEKYAEGGCGAITGGIGRFTGPLMAEMDALVFVGACGIAVRAVAPYIKSKTTDPAVLCADEKGGFVISVLSGHIGGGNRLAAMIAADIGAVPVITTATDVNGKFSVDAWAAENGYHIGSMGAAKRVSAAILENDVPICADAPVKGNLPKGLYPGEGGALGICVSARTKKPFDETLFIIPRVLKLGIGCRRGISCEAIEKAVMQALHDNGLSFKAVREAASVTLKADEEGLLEFCEKYKLPVSFYTPEALMAVEGRFSASEFVKGTVGADNVCERSAVSGGGTLIVPKTAGGGVTVAVAEAAWEVRFE